MTDRGRPVARLVPPATAEGIERLPADRWTTPAKGDLLGHWPPLAARPGVPLPSEIVEAMRSEER